MIQTIKYKSGFIHFSYPDNKTEVVRVQVDPCAYSIEVKSAHAAKLIISKHLKKISTPVKMNGVVKWFNDAKGFGYITAGSIDDIFLHYTALMCEGFKTVKEGVEVNFDLVQGVKGPQAFNVREIK